MYNKMAWGRVLLLSCNEKSQFWFTFISRFFWILTFVFSNFLFFFWIFIHSFINHDLRTKYSRFILSTTSDYNYFFEVKKKTHQIVNLFSIIFHFNLLNLLEIKTAIHVTKIRSLSLIYRLKVVHPTRQIQIIIFIFQSIAFKVKGRFTLQAVQR
jgi:hypothetical protein